MCIALAYSNVQQVRYHGLGGHACHWLLAASVVLLYYQPSPLPSPSSVTLFLHHPLASLSLCVCRLLVSPARVSDVWLTGHVFLFASHLSTCHVSRQNGPIGNLPTPCLPWLPVSPSSLLPAWPPSWRFKSRYTTAHPACFRSSHVRAQNP
jgi:hypothetical protein